MTTIRNVVRGRDCTFAALFIVALAGAHQLVDHPTSLPTLAHDKAIDR